MGDLLPLLGARVAGGSIESQVTLALYAIPLNAEPWTAPTATIIRKGGRTFPALHKSRALDAYQAAVQEQMSRLYPDAPKVTGDFELTFYIWRNLSVDGKVARNAIDATNAQKALEDALQGVLYSNDRCAVHVETWMMEQSARANPLILVEIKPVGFWPVAPAIVALRLAGEWPRPEAVTERPTFDVGGVF